jgi:hypothetical protein
MIEKPPEPPRSRFGPAVQILLGFLVLAFGLWLQWTWKIGFSDFLDLLPPGAPSVFHFLQRNALPFLKSLAVVVVCVFMFRRMFLRPM